MHILVNYFINCHEISNYAIRYDPELAFHSAKCILFRSGQRNLRYTATTIIIGHFRVLPTFPNNITLFTDIRFHFINLLPKLTRITTSCKNTANFYKYFSKKACTKTRYRITTQIFYPDTLIFRKEQELSGRTTS